MSVRKRTLPSGEVRWMLDYRDAGGKRRGKMFATKGAALAYETKARGELAAGTHVADSASITVAEAADIWLAACDAKGLEESTTRAYRNHVKQHIRPFLGDTKLSRLTAPVAQDFVRRLAAEGRNLPTLRKVVTSLHSLVVEAMRQGLATVNAVSVVELPGSSRDEEPPEFPTMAEIKALLAYRGELRPLIHSGLLTGLRPSELRGLTWEHVDFKESVIRVRQRADRLGKLGRPKSKAGRRDIPLGPHLLAMLREWKLAQPAAQRGGGQCRRSHDCLSALRRRADCLRHQRAATR
jgi:integrase